MTIYYLVRHAKKDPESVAGAISKAGENEALTSAIYLKRKLVKAIYTGPITRTSQTDKLMAANLGLISGEDPRLRARANWGDLARQSFEEFGAMWECTTCDPTYQPPIGDTAAGAAHRLNDFLQETVLTNNDTTVVVVTHGSIITDFLLHYFPLVELEKWQIDFLARQSSLIAECSITVIHFKMEITS